jgi:hypothetical protein
MLALSAVLFPMCSHGRIACSKSRPASRVASRVVHLLVAAVASRVASRVVHLLVAAVASRVASRVVLASCLRVYLSVCK